jgi:hypothetical protein
MTFGVVSRAGGELVHRVGKLSGAPPTVCALHEQLLDHVDLRRLSFVPDAATAERAVAAGSATAAYLLPATRVERVWKVVRGRSRLPEKSTYFWPKPRTGMIMRPLDPV